MLIKHIIFSCCHTKMVVAMVMEIVKILQKQMEPEITQKLFKLC